MGKVSERIKEIKGLARTSLDSTAESLLPESRMIFIHVSNLQNVHFFSSLNYFEERVLKKHLETEESQIFPPEFTGGQEQDANNWIFKKDKL